MADKKKSKKKGSKKIAHVQPLSVLKRNAGEVGAAIAGAVLTEVAQAALSKTLNPSTASSTVNESENDIKHKPSSSANHAIDKVKQIAKETLQDASDIQAVHNVIDAVKEAWVDQPTRATTSEDATSVTAPSIVGAVGSAISGAIADTVQSVGAADDAVNPAKTALVEALPAKKLKEKKKGKKTKSKKSGKKGKKKK